MTPPSFSVWRPHPWHGLEPGPDPPRLVTAYVELTPLDVVKYEVDKPTGFLKVDRPQTGSSSPPTLYGFIPRTFCGPRVAALSAAADVADGDPMDICVFSERPITRAEIILTARVVGGFRVIDQGEADDKIVGVLANDPVWNEVQDLEGIPGNMLDRLEHYLLTYKLVPGQASAVDVESRYGRDQAHEVVLAAIEDYRDVFGG